MFKGTLRVTKKAIHSLQHESFSSFVERVRVKISHTYEKSNFKEYVIEKKVAGETIQLLIGNLFSKYWYDRPENSDNWTELIWVKDNALVKGDIVADCGSNIGFTGIFFAKCVGKQGRVIGFEALPSNADIARKNIQLNKASNFELRNQAVGSYAGMIEFNDQPNGSVGQIEGVRTVKTPVVTLDESFPDEKPTFIKIDVEGYEIEVLKGAAEILKTKPKLEIEIHCASFEDRLSCVKELLDLLPLSEYQIFLQLTTDREVISHVLTDNTPDLIAKYDNVHLFAICK
jgi:FkbM family methyltransferase